MLASVIALTAAACALSEPAAQIENTYDVALLGDRFVRGTYGEPVDLAYADGQSYATVTLHEFKSEVECPPEDAPAPRSHWAAVRATVAVAAGATSDFSLQMSFTQFEFDGELESPLSWYPCETEDEALRDSVQPGETLTGWLTINVPNDVAWLALGQMYTPEGELTPAYEIPAALNEAMVLEHDASVFPERFAVADFGVPLPMGEATAPGVVPDPAGAITLNETNPRITCENNDTTAPGRWWVAVNVTITAEPALFDASVYSARLIPMDYFGDAQHTPYESCEYFGGDQIVTIETPDAAWTGWLTVPVTEETGWLLIDEPSINFAQTWVVQAPMIDAPLIAIRRSKRQPCALAAREPTR